MKDFLIVLGAFIICGVMWALKIKWYQDTFDDSALPFMSKPKFQSLFDSKSDKD
jgi:nitrogen fixation-related uncharacterized protein